MARIGGRSAWLAWPVGVICLVVVLALVWLAVPMAPVVVDWAGSALRGELGGARVTEGDAVAPSESAPSTPATAPETPVVPTDGPSSCQEMYPAELWQLLSTTPGVGLLQTPTYPTSAFAGLPEAFGARIEVGCAWTNVEGGSIQSMFAETTPDAAAIASSVLTGAGFTCSDFAAGTRCERPADPGSGLPAETHVLGGGRWVASVRADWDMPDYDALVQRTVWGG